MRRYPIFTFYAIERGKEGVKPRTLHHLRSNIDVTMCGVATTNSVSFVNEADTFCPTCYPEE